MYKGSRCGQLPRLYYTFRTAHAHWDVQVRMCTSKSKCSLTCVCVVVSCSVIPIPTRPVSARRNDRAKPSVTMTTVCINMAAARPWYLGIVVDWGLGLGVGWVGSECQFAEGIRFSTRYITMNTDQRPSPNPTLIQLLSRRSKGVWSWPNCLELD